MYGQVNESNTQRKKLVIVSAVMGIIILILAGVLVNAIINKNKKPVSEIASEGVISTDEAPSDNPEVSRAESAGDSDAKSAESENLNPVSNETDGKQSADRTSETSASSEAKKLPSTGPREVISLALLLGSCAMFISSKLYLKELA